MLHLPRPALASRFPVHVTVRIGDDVPRLRNFKRCKVWLLREGWQQRGFIAVDETPARGRRG